MKKQIYLRQYRDGRQFLLVLLRRAVQFGIRGFEGFRVTSDNKEDDWFIAENILNKGLTEGTIVRFQ